MYVEGSEGMNVIDISSLVKSIGRMFHYNAVKQPMTNQDECNRCGNACYKCVQMAAIPYCVLYLSDLH